MGLRGRAGRLLYRAVVTTVLWKEEKLNLKHVTRHVMLMM